MIQLLISVALASSCGDSNEAAAKVNTWAELDEYRKKYDGCVNNGPQYAVERVLLKHFDTLGEMNQKFVFDHLEITLLHHPHEITKLATSKCPAGQREICAKLIQAEKDEIEAESRPEPDEGD